jgi:hypothetical protein
MKGQGRYFSFSRLTDSSKSLSLSTLLLSPPPVVFSVSGSVRGLLQTRGDFQVPARRLGRERLHGVWTGGGSNCQRVREWPFIRMAVAQGQIGEGRRGWAEISKDPQRYGVYSLPTGPYVVPLYATRFMSPLYLCQSRGNPALAPTALPSILGVLAVAERKDTGSSPVPVCCNSPVEY